MESVITVPKEIIGQASFATKEVLSDRLEIERRRWYLQKALSLGNLFRHKVTITYQLYDGIPQRVVTTVWAVTERYVTLKGGRVIPVHAIREVEL
ncbi:hypothetical protein [Tunicatimonas pelagia]|uniref:hypothetical protein n=1 Tax=Tunicatimonas pelagia TaxID=931531 RepID=UPI0026650BC5|nr:hypothetical protein [Tunicatimonas pelagia]WKN45622.1 hypothetical protein P0M28_11705 [Tunicatimonas pelagia]